MNPCCKDKKYFTELCPACIQAMTTLNLDNAEYLNTNNAYPINDHSFWETVILDPICECGSDKTGGPGHSHWCPKSE